MRFLPMFVARYLPRIETRCMGGPETRYARSGDVAVAYQVLGAGPFDVVCALGTVSHVELNWEAPGIAVLLRSLAEHARSLAAAGEVLVSQTVKDLVAGSGIAFADRDVRQLKGVPGDWRLYSVVTA